jgi:hypothetical protein
VSGQLGTHRPSRRTIALGAAVAVGVGAAAIYLAAGQTPSGLQPVSQPSLPRSSRPVPGLGILRQTSESWRQALGYRAYSYLIVGLDLARRAAREPGRSLVYFSAAAVNRHWDAGVPFIEARRHGWLLRDRAGTLLTSRHYSANFIGDVGNPAYQHAWLDNVTRVLQKDGDSGVFIDGVVTDLASVTGTEAAKYPTARRWANAQLSFIHTVGDGLRAKGYYVLVNASAFVRRSRASDDGTSTVSWWRALAPYVSGLMNEYYQEISNGTNELRATGSSWRQNWAGWQRLVGVAQRHGRDFVGLTYGAAGDARAMSYGKASFLLDWNGRGGAFVYQPANHADPWNGAWTRDIGKPIERKQHVGAAWVRRYSGGVVLLNPDPSRFQRLILHQSYLAPDGAHVSQVTVPPATGLILPNAVRSGHALGQ